MNDNKQENAGLDLEDILKEFRDFEEVPSVADDAEPPALQELLDSVDTEYEEMPVTIEEETPIETGSVSEDTIRLDDLAQVGEETTVQEPDITSATIRLDTEEVQAEIAEQAEAEEASEEEIPEQEEPEFVPPAPIVFDPRAKLRELKRKLVAGPEKRYYELSEIGVGKLQMAMFLCLIVIAVSAGAAVMYSLDLIPENRMRLMVFGQVLAMLLGALLGSYQLLDGLADLFRGKFTANTLLAVTFFACCADSVFCLQEQRVPICAAFTLEVMMSLWSTYHRRTTEMGMMDTMRKATRLNSLVEVEDYYEEKPGLLKGEGQVEDFMNNYQAPSGPQRAQSVYCALSLLLCIAIAVFAGVMHGAGMALQVLSTGLMVAVPASFFVTLSRPAAILERRLHMVGTVLCGWQGVKGLCGKVVFPLQDEDLFPRGSVKLNGVKFYGDRDTEDTIAYSAALMAAAGGTLAPVFEQLRVSRNCPQYTAENVQGYPNGGIGGEIKGESVLLGTLNFLKDMGVEIPEGTMVTQAVYAALDGQLCAVYAITYSRMRSAAAGLVSLCASRKVTPVMVGGDFMLTESFLQNKFRARTRRVVFPTRETRRELQQVQIEEGSVALALTTRDELVSAAYAVSGARALRTACRLGVAIHMIGGIMGMLILLALSYLGSTELLTPVHVLLYQLVWMIPGLLVTEWTRTV